MENFYKAYVMKVNKFFNLTVLKSWWVILFIIFCYMAFEKGIREHRGEHEMLKKQFNELQKDMDLSLGIQQDLILQINSQSDPEWVELVLMKKLGLVPEGHKKFFFKSERQ